MMSMLGLLLAAQTPDEFLRVGACAAERFGPAKRQEIMVATRNNADAPQSLFDEIADVILACGGSSGAQAMLYSRATMYQVGLVESRRELTERNVDLARIDAWFAGLTEVRKVEIPNTRALAEVMVRSLLSAGVPERQLGNVADVEAIMNYVFTLISLERLRRGLPGTPEGSASND